MNEGNFWNADDRNNLIDACKRAIVYSDQARDIVEKVKQVLGSFLDQESGSLIGGLEESEAKDLVKCALKNGKFAVFRSLVGGNSTHRALNRISGSYASYLWAKLFGV